MKGPCSARCRHQRALRVHGAACGVLILQSPDVLLQEALSGHSCDTIPLAPGSQPRGLDPVCTLRVATLGTGARRIEL